MSKLYFRLDLEADELSLLPVPVVVHDGDLAVVARTVASEGLEVKPGLYWVTATMPAGQQLGGTVQVGDDEAATVTLAPSAAQKAPDSRQAKGHYLQTPAKMRGAGATSTTDLPAWQRSLDSPAATVKGRKGRKGLTRPERSFGLDDPLAAATPPQVSLRAFSGNPLRGEATLVVNWKPNVIREGERLLLDWPAGPHGLLILQVLQRGFSPVNALVPRRPGQAGSAVLSRRSDGNYKLAMELNNQDANLLLRYYARGQMQDAAAVTVGKLPGVLVPELPSAGDPPERVAKRLLQGKVDDPIAAAAGAYILLHLGKLDWLHDWTANLCEWYDWLADGLVVWGEHQARAGDHARALETFLRLPERGLPMFVDGLTFAANRLRDYWEHGRAGKDSVLVAPERALELLSHLQSFTNCTRFGEANLVYHGLDPNHPNTDRLEGDPRELGGHDISEFLAP